MIPIRSTPTAKPTVLFSLSFHATENNVINRCAKRKEIEREAGEKKNLCIKLSIATGVIWCQHQDCRRFLSPLKYPQDRKNETVLKTFICKKLFSC